MKSKDSGTFQRSARRESPAKRRKSGAARIAQLPAPEAAKLRRLAAIDPAAPMDDEQSHEDWRAQLAEDFGLRMSDGRRTATALVELEQTHLSHYDR